MTHKRYLAATILALALLILMLGAAAVSANGPLGSISGNVYCDANKNGSFDAGEGMSGVLVSLGQCSGDRATEDASILESGVDGAYSFDSLFYDPTQGTCYLVYVNQYDPDLGFCVLPAGPTEQEVTLTTAVPDAAGVDFGFEGLWELYINGDPWAPGFELIVETSDTVEVVGVISLPIDLEFPGDFVLVESWVSDHLSLTQYSQMAGLTPIVGNGVLTWTVEPYLNQYPQATLTKTFHVEPCTWPETTIDEVLTMEWFDATLDFEEKPPLDMRPIVIKKLQPDLHIDSTYDAEVDPGTQASFVLAYSNTGGFESAAMIRNDFPATAPFASANPPPDRQGTNVSTLESFAEWDLGDLANGDRGEITVNVDIGADLPPSTTIPITDSIYNHIDKEIDTVISTFHIQQPPLELGDFVWFDTNQDGIQDAGEAGVQDITVTLHRRLCSEPAIATEVTDANGKYLFEDLSPGIYCLQFANIPASWTISPQGEGTDDTVDSDADPATAQIGNIDLKETDLDEDMGLFLDGSKGGTVYCDANGNSQLDAGEGVAGVTVTLYDDPGCDGVPINQMDAMDTPAGGAYLFDDLNVGPAGAPVCYFVSVDETDMGTCNVPITPLDYAVRLDTDEPDHLDNDFGFQEPPPEPSSLGDKVWYDTNQNGIQDDTEYGIAGVTVVLYECEGNQLRTTTTAPGGTYARSGMTQGEYLFNDLAAGSYQIGFALPTSDYEFTLQNVGADDALDSDADPTTGRTACIVMAAGVDDMDWDAGMYETIIEAEPPPVVPEANTLLLLGSALTGLAGYAGLQIRARRRK